MSGIYIHIPFCAQRCAYCDFYSSASQSLKTQVIESLKKEIELRHDYLQNKKIRTVYFGGGTPSLLSQAEFSDIMNALHKHFDLSNVEEFTIEANPDDLSKEYIKDLVDLGVNRLSMGIQSFDDEILQFMNRRHNAKEAIKAVHNAVDCGINNLSIDLIYGVPGLLTEKWITSIDTAVNLPVQHISAYHLTYHEGTKMFRDLKKGLFKEMEEEKSVAQFELLIEKTGSAGFDHYEVSNFGKAGCYSQHNSSYWKQTAYLGLGPSAHSYNGDSRQWNISSNKRYVESVGKDFEYFEIENLNTVDKYNDYVITAMRTSWGVNLEFIEEEFGIKFKNFFVRSIEEFVKSNKVLVDNSNYKLSKEGIFLSDMIISELFFVE